MKNERRASSPAKRRELVEEALRFGDDESCSVMEELKSSTEEKARN